MILAEISHSKMSLQENVHHELVREEPRSFVDGEDKHLRSLSEKGGIFSITPKIPQHVDSIGKKPTESSVNGKANQHSSRLGVKSSLSNVAIKKNRRYR